MDDLFSLITNLVTRKREYVIFVGAGFSRDAGVPSGWDILVDTFKKIYIHENEITDANKLTDKVVEEWYLAHPEYSQFGYSEVLEKIFKGDIERREYLKSFFREKQPGEAHRLLAQLVKEKIVRFIFTTNFDDLIEKALDEYNIDYDVISSDETLKNSQSWDKVIECRIYKLHGDYKAGKVRNTIKELETLDPLISEDFQYIINRHGLISIGYAGRDNGVMSHFIKRNTKHYPFYWQYVHLPENSDEYKLFYNLKDKYEVEYKSDIIFLQCDTASVFLGKIIGGIENLERITIAQKANSIDYKNYILNQNDKKIRALSIDLINKFSTQYDEYLKKSNLQREFHYRYKTFSLFSKQMENNFNYLDSLLELDQYQEAEYFIMKLLKHTLNQDWGWGDDFPENSLTYLLLAGSGTIFLRYEKTQIMNKYYSLLRKTNNSNNYVQVIPNLSGYGNGWIYVNQNISKRKFIFPKYQVILENHLPNSLSIEEFNAFDAYIFMDIAINKLNYKWICASRLYHNTFIDIYHKYFHNRIDTKEKAIDFIKGINWSTNTDVYPDGVETVIELICGKLGLTLQDLLQNNTANS